MEFWLDKGVSGFRFDATPYLYENVLFLDEPKIPGKEGSAYNDFNHIYTRDQPENIDLIKEWRKFFDDYPKSRNKTKTV